MNYSVGDVVRIRHDLAERGQNGEFDFSVGYDNTMGEYAGRIMTIAEVYSNSYKLKEDGGRWWWMDEMLESVFNDKKESKMETYSVEHKAVEQIDRAEIIKEMYETLDICRIYHPTDEGLNAILDEWEDKKGRADIWKGNSALDILSKHPNYVPSKGYIVKRNEYDRGVNTKVITDVLSEIVDITSNPMDAVIDEVVVRPWSFLECRIYRDKLKTIVDAMSYDDELVYRGMNVKQVKKERNEWEQRMKILQEEYIVKYNKCYNREDVAKMNKVSAMINKIKDHVAVIISKLTEEELMQPIVIDEVIVKYIEESELGIRGIRVGQKLNKVIVKILTETKIKDKWSDYNRQLARFGDAASPTKFTRFTIISANPIDYWRMSFGSSWKSCHTIDKEGYYRPSDGGDGYEGMHASGCSSYMLDPSTVVMYTVDKAYDGNDYELEPKVNRCLFHIGEEKFVMGRVYPQGTDGADEVYRQWRQIFQQIISECMGVDNYWKTLKDRDQKFDQIRSFGTHYRDYECSYCDIAGWSYLKPTADATPSPKYITIGATPICPCCGQKHWVEDNIECDECNEYGEVECYECGYTTDRENMHEIDGHWYCEDCCFYCEYHEEWEVGSPYYVENYGNVCEDAIECDDFNYCPNCDAYYYIGCDDSGVYTEDGTWYCSEDCAENSGYVFCEDVELWFNKEEVFYCDECGRWVTEDNWDFEREMCIDCVDENEDADRETA